jgi:hypothetical protein
MFGAGGNFPPPDAPPEYLTRITIEKVGGVGGTHRNRGGRQARR